MEFENEKQQTGLRARVLIMHLKRIFPFHSDFPAAFPLIVSDSVCLVAQLSPSSY